MAAVPEPEACLRLRELKLLCGGYAALRKLLNQQVAAIEARDLGRLCRIVNAKERWVGELNRLHALLDDTAAADPLHAPIKFAELLAQPGLAPLDVRRLVEPLPRLAEEMVQIEQSSIRRLLDMQEAVQQEIDQLAQGRRTLRSYRSAPAAPPSNYLERCG